MENYMSIEENTESLKDKSEHKGNGKKKSFFRSIMAEILFYIALALICLFIIPRYVIQRTIVSGASMENTLQTGDNLLVEKLSYRFQDPERFDVVIFYPYGKKVDEYYVKRVIGLPGETIQIKGTHIYINGEQLEEDYGKNAITFSGIAEDAIQLGEDEFFLMGDNRKVSLDSRYEEVGLVHKDLIAGRAVLRIWPLSAFGTFR